MRRIEAVTGAAAEALVAETQHRLNEAAGALRRRPADVPDAAASAAGEIAAGWSGRSPNCRRSWRPAAARPRSSEVNGVKLAARNLGEVPARDLKGLAEAIGKQIGSGVVALVSTAEGKASIVVGVSPDLTGRFNAVDLVRAASAAVGGKGGGGRPDMAQAGGPDGRGRTRRWRRCGGRSRVENTSRYSSKRPNRQRATSVRRHLALSWPKTSSLWTLAFPFS